MRGGGVDTQSSQQGLELNGSKVLSSCSLRTNSRTAEGQHCALNSLKVVLFSLDKTGFYLSRNTVYTSLFC